MTSLWNTSVWWLANNLSLVLCGDIYSWTNINFVWFILSAAIRRYPISNRSNWLEVECKWIVIIDVVADAIENEKKFLLRHSSLFVGMRVCVCVQKLANASPYITIYMVCVRERLCVSMCLSMCAYRGLSFFNWNI